MTWVEKLYLPAILGGMRITLKHLFSKKTTISYPEQKREFSQIYRGMHVLKRDEKGAERCTACGLCAVACPAEAITMVAAERKKGEEHLYREEKYAATYEINMFIASAVISTLYFGGYNFPFMNDMGLSSNAIAILGVIFLFAKIFFFIFFFMWIRWTIPRFRYDQLMRLGWTVLIPLAIFNILLTGAIIFATNN